MRSSFEMGDPSSGAADHTADSTATPTMWMSLRSTSEKLSVPVGTGLVEFGALDPLVSANSVIDAAPGPLVTTVASFAPSTVTVTVCVDWVEPSLTLTL